MGHAFSQVPRAEIQRSQFDRTSGHKTTFDAGYLVPIYLDEVLPGDTFQLNMTAIVRMLSPLQVPVMDNMFLESFFFFVPNRLVWNNWQKFNGEQTDPGDSTDFTIPVLTAYNNAGIGSVFDYYGLPVGALSANITTINALPFRGMNLIWNEWFRDQNLQDSVTVTRTDGPDSTADYTLLKRGKRHDYFTSCLPDPQKGDAVSLPLGSVAPIVGTGIPTFDASGGGTQGGRLTAASTADVSGVNIDSPTSSWTAGQLLAWDDPQLQADLTNATAATINQLRQAFAVQRLLERDARGGTRYTEIIRAHFGVISPDARLQRPEYLGGGSSMVQISEVEQNSAQSATGTTTPQGWLAATVRAGATGHGFVKSFTEHGYIHGFVCVRADLTYQQRVDRLWSRSTREEFYWPALSHIGEQAVESREIFADGSANDLDVFGYQERYGEYRYKPSQITGKLRSVASGSLDMWHLSQEFATRPTLNSVFIEEDPPLDRISAVTTEPHFVFDSYISLKCARPMPLFGVPGLIDHF